MNTAVPEAAGVLSVSELTSSLKGLLESQYNFIAVVGEVSNLRVPYSGHHYFTLKDDKAQLKAVLFKGQLRYLTESPAEGQLVLCKGRISVYEPRGEYQLIIDHLVQYGAGQLQLELERLKAKLAAEGVFDQKRTLPAFCRRLCLITSPGGAAVHDFLRIAFGRDPKLQVEIIPAAMQGKAAPAEIMAALELAQERNWAEVVVLARGGGSLEDLWCFNDEMLVRRIAASSLPVVTAIGHEIDFTLADFAADQRAPTPSAAAELLSSDYRQLQLQIHKSWQRLNCSMSRQLSLLRERLNHQRRRLGDPTRLLQNNAMRLDHGLGNLNLAMAALLQQKRGQLHQVQNRLVHLSPQLSLAQKTNQIRQLQNRLANAMAANLSRLRLQLTSLAARVDSLSPLAVLARGYSLTYSPQGNLINSVRQVNKGEHLQLQLTDGRVEVVVERVIDKPKSEEI